MKHARKIARARREEALWGPRFAAATTPEQTALAMWDLLRSRISHLPPTRQDQAWTRAASWLHAEAERVNTHKVTVGEVHNAGSQP